LNHNINTLLLENINNLMFHVRWTSSTSQRCRFWKWGWHSWSSCELSNRHIFINFFGHIQKNYIWQSSSFART